jgi:cytochrome c-type biogenesis protein CcmF
MIIELGHFAAISALVLLAFQVLSAWYAASSQSVIYLAFSRRCLKVGAVLLLLSFGTLWYGFICDEFSLLVVAAYSSATLPWLYQCVALCSSHSGGMMLWLLCLYATMYRLAMSRAHFRLELNAYMQVVMGFFAFTLLACLLFYLNPFARTLPIFPDVGRDLTPVLQYGAVLLHVPLVYGAYALLSVPYVYIAAQLLHGRVDWRGLVWLKPWMYGGWALLTMAIAMAIFLANHVAGWGGLWDWDPAENILLLMWLLDSARLHAVCYSTRHRGFLPIVVTLSIALFLLCLASSFLLHSNMLSSVHHFSPDGPAAMAFLMVLAVNGMIGIVLYITRKHIFLVSDPWVAYSSSRTMLHGIVIFVMMAGVLVLGLLYPIWIGVMRETMSWIGSPYYQRMFAGFLMPMAMLMSWHIIQENQAPHYRALMYGGVVMLVFVITAFWWPSHLDWGYAFFCIMLASGLAFLLAIGYRIQQAGWYYLVTHGAMICAHLGVWLLILGAYCSTSLTQSGEVILSVGESADVGGVTLTAERSYLKRGDNYLSEIVDIEVETPSGMSRHMHPEIRTYDVTKDVLPIVVVEPVGLYSLRLILLRHPHHSWSVMWFWVPYAFLVRLGACLLLLGVLWAGLVAWRKRFYLQKDMVWES